MGQESGKRPKFDPDTRTGSNASVPPGAQDEHQAFNTVVGEGIRRARQEHGWTQAHLADQARLSPNYIARLERGELGPSLFVANRICEALTIPLEDLVGPGSSSGAARKTTTKRRAAG
jgi:ribosome-binding protein aMBF1 (putative translation factor)